MEYLPTDKRSQASSQVVKDSAGIADCEPLENGIHLRLPAETAIEATIAPVFSSCYIRSQHPIEKSFK